MSASIYTSVLTSDKVSVNKQHGDKMNTATLQRCMCGRLGAKEEDEDELVVGMW